MTGPNMTGSCRSNFSGFAGIQFYLALW